MTFPAKGPHYSRRYFHRATTDVKPDLSSPALDANIWIAEVNENVIFNVKARMIHSAATPKTFDMIVCELRDGNVANNISNAYGLSVSNAVFSSTYQTSPAPAAYLRMLALVFTNIDAAVEYDIWIT